MAEKWTAADEKLWADLNTRRIAIREQRESALRDALALCGIVSHEAWLVAAKLAIAPVQVAAALEPYVLDTRETAND